jgi:hypothetical protein
MYRKRKKKAKAMHLYLPSCPLKEPLSIPDENGNQ